MARISISYEIKLVAILMVTFGFVFFDRTAIGFLMPFIAKDLQLSNMQIGILVSALSLTWASAGYFVSKYSDSTGQRKKILLVAIVMFSVCSFLSGLSQSFMMLLAARLLMGFFEGPILPISQSFVALASSEKRRGVNMGIMQNFGSSILGQFAAPLILVAIANAYDWRVAFFAAGVPGLICAVFVAKTVREPKIAVKTTATAGQEQDKTMSLGQMVRYRNIWLCMLLSSLMIGWQLLGFAFLPLWFVDGRNISPAQMSMLMAALGISATFASFFVAGLSDRFGRKPVMIFFCFSSALCPLAALYFNDSLVGLGILLALGWMGSGTFPIFMATIPSETIPARYMATSLGLVMGIGEIFGGVVMPVVAGWFADLFGLAAPIFMQVGLATMAGVIALFLIETAPVKLASAKLKRA